MNVAVRRQWTQQEFFDWAEAQERRYEFDGFQPVAMTGGNNNHSGLHRNIVLAVGNRLRGQACQVFGPDAGVATVGSTVRFPDAVVTCARVVGTDRLLPGVIVVFEVISPTSGGLDRIVKLREYAAVPSILRYVIVESAMMGLTVLSRGQGDANWTATALGEGDVLVMPEIGIELPVADIYERIDLPPEPPDEGR